MEGIKKIAIKDKNYPKTLKEITNPPKFLYIRGEFSNEDIFFAVVGTRKPSLYGKDLTLDITGDLVEAGLTIVSGLAPGIDTFAHQSAVEKNKKTVAVLGTGIDEKSIYPRQNLKLARQIIEKGGCLISEYPPGTHGSKSTFPQRNRIIAGLSLGILVVEAKQKSGALITANYAFSQKKKIFAVPGPVYSLNSKGPHFLIKKGAKLVENANDILQDLNFPNVKASPIKGGTQEEILILKKLKEKPIHIDKIIEETKLSASTIASALAILEIKGKVRNLGGNIWTIYR